MNRRTFLKIAGATVAGAAMPAAMVAKMPPVFVGGHPVFYPVLNGKDEDGLPLLRTKKAHRDEMGWCWSGNAENWPADSKWLKKESFDGEDPDEPFMRLAVRD